MKMAPEGLNSNKDFCEGSSRFLNLENYKDIVKEM